MTTRIERSAHLSGTALFIRRPILAFVLNAMILIAGLAGWLGGEVRELPDVTTPAPRPKPLTAKSPPPSRGLRGAFRGSRISPPRRALAAAG
jgi:hypothetical protein